MLYNYESFPRAVFRLPGNKLKLHTAHKLNLPRIVELCVDRTELAVRRPRWRNRCIRFRELCTVRQVEGLGAEFEAHSFCDIRVLRQRNVEVVDALATQDCIVTCLVS